MRSESAPPSDDAIAAQAAEWIVRLSADAPAERAQAQAGFEQWRRDPRHAEVAAHMQGFLTQVQVALADNPQPARATLKAVMRPVRRRAKRVTMALTLLVVLVMPIALMLHTYPAAYLLADLHAGSGQWQHSLLADGTGITLNSQSAVNVHYDSRQRVVELIKGDVLVEVAKEAARPFVVKTEHGSVRALGTRFVVSHQDAATVLTMLESTVSVQPGVQTATQTVGKIVTAGQRVSITATSVSATQTVDVRSVADAWRFHQLVVDNRPLTEVLDELSRHRPGYLRYNREQLAGLNVSAVLPVDDTDQALQLLMASFPQLRIRAWPYLVWVDAPPT